MVREAVKVATGVWILPEDVEIKGIRSRGPGGQNVNKVATTAVLFYDPARAKGLPEDVRSKVLEKVAGRLTRKGFLVLRCGLFRTFGRNRTEVLARLKLLLQGALKERKRRLPTKPGKGAVERRLSEKKIQSRRKRERRKDLWRDD